MLLVIILLYCSSAVDLSWPLAVWWGAVIVIELNAFAVAYHL